MQLYVAGVRPEPLPEAGNSSGARWWLTPYGRWRLEAEAEAIRERFPGFRLVQAEGDLHWLGWLRSALSSESRYLVRVSYPPGYPDEAPEVAIERPELPEGTPHLLVGREPCLYRSGRRDGYDPGRTTAATLVAWTALWIHAFETWRATGHWPGRAD